MQKNNIFTKILAVAGALLVWLTILSPLLFGLANVIFNKGVFHLDYLMPAEFFPVALLGGIFLVWAAIVAHTRRGLVGWGLAVAVLSLVGGQALAVVSGLASGATDPASFWGAVVIATLIIYMLALLVIGIGSLRLLGDLSKSSREPT